MTTQLSVPRPALARRLVLALLAVLCLAAVAAPVTHAGPVAHRAASCKAFSISGGYITSLKVTHTSCATGKKVAMAYTKCRRRHGVKGRCTSKVDGYSCKEGTRQSIPTEFDARVTCKSGSRTVVHTYQQDLS